MHEKLAHGKLREIHKASGGPWGGMYVDKAYIGLLDNIFGNSALKKLKEIDINEYVEILREFETKKRKFDAKKGDKMTLRLSAVLNELSEKYSKVSPQDEIKKYDGKVEIFNKFKIKIHPSLIQEWFDDLINPLVCHLQSLLLEVDSINSLLLVGGFSESIYVQERLIKELKEKKVIVVSREAELAVLKGAVLFGHDPSLFASRIMKYSYGVKCREKFQKQIHPSSARVMVDGEAVVENAFSVFVKANEPVKYGHEVTRTYFPSNAANTCSCIEIFRSEDANPVTVNGERCEKLGELYIQHPTGETKVDKEMLVTFIFGDTELKVKVQLSRTAEVFDLNINYLDLGINTSCNVVSF